MSDLSELTPNTPQVNSINPVSPSSRPRLRPRPRPKPIPKSRQVMVEHVNDANPTSPSNSIQMVKTTFTSPSSNLHTYQDHQEEVTSLENKFESDKYSVPNVSEKKSAQAKIDNENEDSSSCHDVSMQEAKPSLPLSKRNSSELEDSYCTQKAPKRPRILLDLNSDNSLHLESQQCVTQNKIYQTNSSTNNCNSISMGTTSTTEKNTAEKHEEEPTFPHLAPNLVDSELKTMIYMDKNDNNLKSNVSVSKSNGIKLSSNSDQSNSSHGQNIDQSLLLSDIKNEEELIEKTDFTEKYCCKIVSRDKVVTAEETKIRNIQQQQLKVHESKVDKFIDKYVQAAPILILNAMNYDSSGTNSSLSSKDAPMTIDMPSEKEINIESKLGIVSATIEKPSRNQALLLCSNKEQDEKDTKTYPEQAAKALKVNVKEISSNLEVEVAVSRKTPNKRLKEAEGADGERGDNKAYSKITDFKDLISSQKQALSNFAHVQDEKITEECSKDIQQKSLDVVIPPAIDEFSKTDHLYPIVPDRNREQNNENAKEINVMNVPNSSLSSKDAPMTIDMPSEKEINIESKLGIVSATIEKPSRNQALLLCSNKEQDEKDTKTYPEQAAKALKVNVKEISSNLEVEVAVSRKTPNKRLKEAEGADGERGDNKAYSKITDFKDLISSQKQALSNFAHVQDEKITEECSKDIQQKSLDVVIPPAIDEFSKTDHLYPIVPDRNREQNNENAKEINVMNVPCVEPHVQIFKDRKDPPSKENLGEFVKVVIDSSKCAYQNSAFNSSSNQSVSTDSNDKMKENFCRGLDLEIPPVGSTVSSMKKMNSCETETMHDFKSTDDEGAKQHLVIETFESGSDIPYSSNLETDVEETDLILDCCLGLSSSPLNDDGRLRTSNYQGDIKTNGIRNDKTISEDAKNFEDSMKSIQSTISSKSMKDEVASTLCSTTDYEGKSQNKRKGDESSRVVLRKDLSWIVPEHDKTFRCKRREFSVDEIRVHLTVQRSKAYGNDGLFISRKEIGKFDWKIPPEGIDLGILNLGISNDISKTILQGAENFLNSSKERNIVDTFLDNTDKKNYSNHDVNTKLFKKINRTKDESKATVFAELDKERRIHYVLRKLSLRKNSQKELFVSFESIEAHLKKKIDPHPFFSMMKRIKNSKEDDIITLLNFFFDERKTKDGEMRFRVHWATEILYKYYKKRMFRAHACSIPNELEFKFQKVLSCFPNKNSEEDLKIQERNRLLGLYVRRMKKNNAFETGIVEYVEPLQNRTKGIVPHNYKIWSIKSKKITSWDEKEVMEGCMLGSMFGEFGIV